MQKTFTLEDIETILEDYRVEVAEDLKGSPGDSRLEGEISALRVLKRQFRKEADLAEANLAAPVEI